METVLIHDSTMEIIRTSTNHYVVWFGGILGDYCRSGELVDVMDMANSHAYNATRNRQMYLLEDYKPDEDIQVET